MTIAEYILSKKMNRNNYNFYINGKHITVRSSNWDGNAIKIKDAINNDDTFRFLTDNNALNIAMRGSKIINQSIVKNYNVDQLLYDDMLLTERNLKIDEFLL